MPIAAGLILKFMARICYCKNLKPVAMFSMHSSGVDVGVVCSLIETGVLVSTPAVVFSRICIFIYSVCLSCTV